jgi:lipoprotein-anchoring transpeptidase ErfK/SrfK
MSENKKQSDKPKPTVRSGRLMYRAYGGRNGSNQTQKKGRSFRKIARRTLALALVVVIGLLVYSHYQPKKAQPSGDNNQAVASTTKAKTPPPIQTKAPATTTPVASTACSSNTIAQLALVSISKRQMWACQGSTQVYSSAVITGMENFPADLTPVGTYTIYAKETNLYLNGSDSTGSWHDYVYYWMPFLHNQYGSYGFHDATWRDPSAFGNISPYSDQASHGCVEMPLATATWLYNWAQIGTTVTIES